MDPEEIVRKRLARLQGKKNHDSPSPEITPEASNPQPIVTPPAAQSKPTVKPVVSKASTPSPSKPAVNGGVKPTSPSPKTPPTPQQLKQYDHQLVCDILMVSLVKDGLKAGYTYLEGCVEELAEETKQNVDSLLITDALVESVLMNRLANNTQSQPLFHYLNECYDRSVLKSSKSPMTALIQKLLISNMGMVLIYPDIFPQPESVISETCTLFGESIIADQGTKKYMRDIVLDQLIERYIEESPEELFFPCFYHLESLLVKMTVVDNVMRVYNGMMRLVSRKPLLALIPQLKNWMPEAKNGSDYELQSFLGSFLGLSMLPREHSNKVVEAYFQNPLKRGQMDIKSSIQSLQTTTQNFQSLQYNLIFGLLKPGTREDVLKYLAQCLQLNERRYQQYHARGERFSSDDYLINLAQVFLRLCVPFMGEKKKIFFSKMVDSYFCNSACRVTLEKETCFISTEKERITYIESQPKETNPPHFIAECFSLTAYLLHLGVMRTCRTYNKLLKDLREIQSVYQRLMQRVPTSDPMTETQEEYRLEKIRTHLEKSVAYKYALDAVLLSPGLIENVLSFYSLASQWLIHLADPENNGFPFDEPTDVFKNTPEFLLENILEYLIFVCRFQFDALKNNLPALESIIQLLVLFTGAEKHVKNPHLRSKIAEAMFLMTEEVQQSDTPFLAIVETDPVALKCLVPSLVKFYVEIESTGSSNQFYEKFEVRYHLAILLSLLWKIGPHRENMKVCSSTELFVRFINLLMNDTTYLLDESLSKLHEIRDTQREMENASLWEALPQEEREEKEKTLQSNTRHCKTYLTLASETVGMFQYLTKEILAPFLRPELVDRLASMLNYNLKKLVGPECQNLKVRDPEKINFDPKKLVRELTDIYIQLCKDDISPDNIFIQAIGRDGRSFNTTLFPMAQKILTRISEPTTKIEQFAAIGVCVQSSIDQSQLLEQELGDIPEEFMDPLMYTLMSDPVTLPTSGNVIDRSTITTHLLSDMHDPFNRKPLTVDDLIPNDELKKKIDEWRKRS